jgi:hypothetical protein
MIRNQFLSATLSITGLFLVAPAVTASPVVKINDGQSNSCTVTPSTGTVFTLSTQGDVLINGSYGSNCNIGGGGGTGSGPTFTPLNPAPANLSVLPSSLGSQGGPVTPSFVVYNTKTCIGQVTATAGCAAAPAPWGTGGTVCSAAAGQSYCSPSGTVAIPGNTTGSACSYTFQAVNCTDNTTSINSLPATVSVSASGGGGGCVDGSASDLPGYTRQCSGSATNYQGTATWNNTFASLFNGPWPGNAGQVGKSWTVTVNANQYASFMITTGTTQAGIQLPTNNSVGQTGMMSISTAPGDFVSGSIICATGSLSISSKSGTTAQCKLAANTTYYMNISMASSFGPLYTTTCTTSACTTGWTFNRYD